MKLSTKGRYGARLMLDLALHYGNGPVLLKDIAERQGISEKYLGHLVGPLKAAGLINSSRGARGGYALAKPAKEITLADVISVLEGEIALVECVNKATLCHRVELCVTRGIWARMSEKIMEVLSSTTLESMVKRYREKQESHPLIYSI